MSPPRSAALACQRDPERWFSPASRRYTLALCLQCPQRSWCAREALKGASHGMWAGIWIDNNLADVAHYLHDIAQPPDAAAQPPVPAPAGLPDVARNTSPSSVDGETAADDAREAEERRRAVMTIVMARSCGHCEVMTPQCRYSVDTLGSRIPGQPGRDAPSPSASYAACRPCQQVLDSIDPTLARRLGYVVDPPRRPGFVPIYWRQARWVYFDNGPTVLPAKSPDELRQAM